jgi:hypothetical protein
MPEVTRIEKTFPGPDGFAAAMKEYPAMRDQAKKDLVIYRSAIVAAEKASPRPISEYGAAAIKKGRSVWAGADQVDKARLAQVWMSWSPPGDCETRAKTLETKSNLFGQALNYNVKKDAAPAPDAEPESRARDRRARGSGTLAARPRRWPKPPSPRRRRPTPRRQEARRQACRDQGPRPKPAQEADDRRRPCRRSAPRPRRAMPIAAKGEVIIDPERSPSPAPAAWSPPSAAARTCWSARRTEVAPSGDTHMCVSPEGSRRSAATPSSPRFLNQPYDALGVRTPVARSIATRPNFDV